MLYNILCIYIELYKKICQAELFWKFFQYIHGISVKSNSTMNMEPANSRLQQQATCLVSEKKNLGLHVPIYKT